MSFFWSILMVARLDFKGAFGSLSSALPLILSASMGVITISLILSGLGGEVNSRIAYIVPGLIGIFTISGMSTVSSALEADRSNGALVLLVMSPARPVVLVFGHIFGLILRLSIQISVVLVVASLITGRTVWPSSLGAATLACFVLFAGAVFYGSLGALICIWSPLPALSQLPMMILLSGSVITSTAYIPLGRLPEMLRSIAIWNPLSFICDVLRSCLCEKCGDLNLMAAGKILGLMAIFLALVLLSSRRLETKASN